MKPVRTMIYALFSVLLFSAGLSAEDHPSRIVSLAPSVTEMLFAMGLGEKIVGVTTYCIYPEEAREKPKVGGFTDHSVEAIIQQNPDLVIMSPNRGTKFTHEELKQMGVHMLVVPLYGLDDLVNGFDLIGAKTGHEEIAGEIRAEFEDTIEKVKTDAAGRPPRTVAFVNWQTPLMIAGHGTLEGDIVELAGGKNIAEVSANRYPKWSIEAFFGADPDIIIDASSHGRWDDMNDRRNNSEKFWKQYSSLRAVREGRIYLFKKNVYSVPGPRTLLLIRGVNEIMASGDKTEGEYFERVQL